MNKKLTALIKYLTFLGLGIFLVIWSLKKIPDGKWYQFKAVLESVRYELIIPVCLLMMLGNFIRSLRWKVLMEPMDYHPSNMNAYFALIIGYFANTALPRFGEVLKCTILAKYEKIPADKLVGTILAERAFDLISLIVVFSIALMLRYNIVSSYGMELFNHAAKNSNGTFSVLRLCLGSITALLLIVTIIYIIRRNYQSGIVKKIKKIARGIKDGLMSLRYLKKKKIFFFYSITIWLIYLLSTWIGLKATRGTDQLNLGYALSVLAFGSIGMILTPGGIGTYAYFVAMVLVRCKVPFEIGFANGTLQWFAQFLMNILLGFIALTLLPLYNQKRKKKKLKTDHGNHPGTSYK